MRIQATNMAHFSNFRGRFESSAELERIMSVANEKDLIEFSLMLDVINNTNDSKIFYVKEKKVSALNPEKGFVLWCQEHWDSFPKVYKNVVIDNMENNKKLSPVLKKFIDLLQSVYNVNLGNDIKKHLQKQIANKLFK